MGNTLAANGFLCAFHPSSLVIEEAEVIAHEADQPDLLGHLSNAHFLIGERTTEIDLAATYADSTAVSDRDRAVVKMVFELAQACI